MASQGEVPLIASSWPGAQSLDLEDLMAELRARVSAARRSEDRLSELRDAVVAVSAAAEGSNAGAVAADPLSHRTVGVAPDGSAWAELRAARQPVLLTAAAASSANPGLRDDLARVLGGGCGQLSGRVAVAAGPR
jgi:hypothetical protein